MKIAANYWRSKKLIIAIVGAILLFHVIIRQISNSIGASIYLKEIYRDVVYGANSQLEADAEILKKTMLFMTEQRNQYDPEVIDFVGKILIKPSKKNINLHKPNKKHFSQSDQSKYVDNLLKSRRNGFFIEAGAFDGESYSNSLFFERERNWTGLLIEPIPRYFNQLRAKNRRAFALNACIASDLPMVSRFRVNHALSGRVSQMTDEIREAISSESLFEKFTYLPCYSLNTVLKAINVTQIDYFSLDVEGGEADVVESLDLDKLSIEVFSIEVFKSTLNRKRILRALTPKGYKLIRDDGQDLIFQKHLN